MIFARSPQRRLILNLTDSLDSSLVKICQSLELPFTWVEFTWKSEERKKEKDELNWIRMKRINVSENSFRWIDERKRKIRLNELIN